MKWSGWIVVSLAAVTVAANAAEPRLAPPRLARVSVARYTADDPKAPLPAVAPGNITPHAPVHFRQASWDIWSGTATGYVYAPGACDYTPPCVNHLWDGYVQRPHRCNGIHMHGCHGHRGCGSCGGGCDTCGSASSGGCGGGHCSLLKRAHGCHFGRSSGCSSCGDIAPSCGAPTCAAPSCGFDGKGSYDVGPAPADVPAPPMPTADGDAPKVDAPAPAPEKTTRSQRLRGFTWPESPLQR